MAWAKGLKELFEYMNYIKKKTGKVFEVDLYGSGPHYDEITAAAKKGGLPVSTSVAQLFYASNFE
jgi:dTDP-4-amino-4,6-dideoxygalactose transaminase